MKGFADLAGFFAAMGVLIANPFKFMDAIIDALRAAKTAGVKNALLLEEFIGKSIAKWLSNLMLMDGVVFGLLLWGIDYTQENLVRKVMVEKGIYSTLVLVCLMALGTRIFTALLMRWRGEHRPGKVSFFMSGFVSTVGNLISWVFLIAHALKEESGWMCVIVAIWAVVTTAEMVAVLTALSWIVRKLGAFAEIAIALVAEPLVAILPGVTLKTAPERLRKLLDLIQEELWGARIRGIYLGFAQAIIPLYIIISFYVSVSWAVLFGGFYLSMLAIAWFAIQVGAEEEVKKKRKALALFLLHWLWLPTILLRTCDLIASDILGRAIRTQVDTFVEWSNAVLLGYKPLVEYREFWTNIAAIAVIIVSMAVLRWMTAKTEGWKKSFAGMLASVLFLALVPFVLGLGINAGAWGQGKLGWNPCALIQAKTQEERIVISKLRWHWVTENQINFAWDTDKPADCGLEIIELRGGEHERYKPGKEVEAFSSQPFNTMNGQPHEVDLINLAPGMTIAYKVLCRLVNEDSEYNGRITETGVETQGTTHPNLVKPVVTSPLPTPSVERAAPPKSRVAERAKDKVDQDFDAVARSYGVDPD